MTPSLFDLPVRTGEAAAIANLVFEVAGEKPLSEDLRGRIAARAGLLRLENTVPYFGSLERDPIHPAAIYLAIDAIGGEHLLLRMAPATTPSSGLFPKSILIGRLPGPKGQELVINALPFAPGDHDAVRTFAEQVNTAFLPRPQGNRSAIIAVGEAAKAFEAFRAILKNRGINFAGVADANEGIWAAIRTGWREGYTAETPEFAVPAEMGKEFRDQIAPHLLCSQFTADARDIALDGAALAAAKVFDALRELKTARRTARTFDLCIRLRSAAQAADFLSAWREGGRAPILIKPDLHPADSLADLAAEARAFQSVLAVDHVPPVSGLRLNCRVATQEIADAAQVLV